MNQQQQWLITTDASGKQHAISLASSQLHFLTGHSGGGTGETTILAMPPGMTLTPMMSGPSTGSSPNAALTRLVNPNVIQPNHQQRHPPYSSSSVSSTAPAQVTPHSSTSQAATPKETPVSNSPPKKKARVKMNGRSLANHIPDGKQDMAYSLEAANARIKKVKSSNRFETDQADVTRLSEWMSLRPGIKGQSLSPQQRADVVQFYELFRPKYSAKWLILQVEAKYGLSSLRAYFSRFMTQCYKVTNMVQKGTGSQAVPRQAKTQASVLSSATNGPLPAASNKPKRTRKSNKSATEPRMAIGSDARVPVAPEVLPEFLTSPLEPVLLSGSGNELLTPTSVKIEMNGTDQETTTVQYTYHFT